MPKGAAQHAQEQPADKTASNASPSNADGQSTSQANGASVSQPGQAEEQDNEAMQKFAKVMKSVLQVPTYVAYGKPKPFTARKDEDFEIFLARMEDYFVLSQTKDTDRLVSLLLNLDGSARKATDILKIREIAY